MKEIKKTYERPLVELIDIRPEGVLCNSNKDGSMDSYGEGTGGSWD